VEASAGDVDRAVSAARRALEDRHCAWHKMSASERGLLIWRLADLLILCTLRTRGSAVLVGVSFGSHPMLFKQVFHPIVQPLLLFGLWGVFVMTNRLPFENCAIFAPSSSSDFALYCAIS
jgi:hypothetical protein